MQLNAMQCDAMQCNAVKTEESYVPLVAAGICNYGRFLQLYLDIAPGVPCTLLCRLPAFGRVAAKIGIEWANSNKCTKFTRLSPS